MAELKTKATSDSVEAFIASLSNEQQQADSRRLVGLMQDVSGEPAVMWGGSIIGFGAVSMKYASGRELDWLRVGFSPRAGKISLYVTTEADELTARFKSLGKYKTGKGCIYLKQLSDIDEGVLKKLLKAAYDESGTSKNQKQ